MGCNTEDDRRDSVVDRRVGIDRRADSTDESAWTGEEAPAVVAARTAEAPKKDKCPMSSSSF